MIWELDMVSYHAAHKLCAEGWEPFAVVQLAGGDPVVYVRRVKKPDELGADGDPGAE